MGDLPYRGDQAVSQGLHRRIPCTGAAFGGSNEHLLSFTQNNLLSFTQNFDTHFNIFIYLKMKRGAAPLPLFPPPSFLSPCLLSF